MYSEGAGVSQRRKILRTFRLAAMQSRRNSRKMYSKGAGNV